MAKAKINDSEKIFVKVEQNNLVYIDPNSVIDNDGNVQPRGINHENLVVYVNLEADIVPRSILVASNDQNTLTSIAKGTLNFLTNQNGRDYDTNWTNAFNGTDNQKKDEEILKVENTNFDSTGQSFGIDSLQITIKGFNAIPQVSINFTDVRGKTLFESPENSPYQAFFHIPWPIFYLTLKGYYGKAIRYRLHLVKFNTRFNESNGNFEIQTTFVGSTYAHLSDIPLKGIMNAPYMYMIENTVDSKENTKNNTSERKVSRSSKGYATLAAVYSEYRRKGLIPNDFPVKTLREVIVAAQNLDKTLEKQILDQVIDGRLFVGLKDYEDNLNNFQKSIDSWAVKNLSRTFETDFLTTTNGIKYYELSGQNKANKDIIFDKNKEGTLERIIELYRDLINKSSLFNDAITRTGDVDFRRETLVKGGFGDINDYTRVKDTQYQVAFDRLTNDINNLFTVFAKQKEKLIKIVESKMNDVIKTTSNKDSLGFEPTIRNIFAVVLANADTYIRLLKDVHRQAFDVAEERKKRLTGLSTETKGNNSIYPWPEIKKSSDGQKQKVIAYPGDDDLIGVLGSDSKILWPEVDFVENFIDITTNRVDTNTDKESGIDQINFIFGDEINQDNLSKITTMSTLMTSVPYIDKIPSAYLYEIWERAIQFTLLETFNNQTLVELANNEFKNIKETSKNDELLISIMKDRIKTPEDLQSLMRSFSPFERYPYYEDQIPTTPYLLDSLEYSHKIEPFSKDYKSIASLSDQESQQTLLSSQTPTKQTPIKEYEKLSNNLKNYVTQDYRYKIYPFNSSTYLDYIQKTSYEKTELDFDDLFEVDTINGFIRTPINGYNWIKPKFRSDEKILTNLFTNKLNVQNTKVHILNTPYFHKQLYSDFSKESSFGKYVGSAYLLLNSLPFLDLDDNVSFDGYDSNVRLSSIFREIGSSHFIPYHLILKWGSLYHRYKKYILEEEDILDGFLTTGFTSTAINGFEFFNNSSYESNFLYYNISGTTITYKLSSLPTPTPTATVSPTPSISVTPTITQSSGISPTPTPSISITLTTTPTMSSTPTSSITPTPSITPTLSINPSASPTPSVTPTLSPTASVSPTLSPTPSITPTPINFDDVGIHPFYDAVFHQILNNYTHYNTSQGNTSFSTNVSNQSIRERYRTESNNTRYWTGFVDNSKFDSTDKRYTILPSDGGNKNINKKKVLSKFPIKKTNFGFDPIGSSKKYKTSVDLPFLDDYEITTFTYDDENFDKATQSNFRCLWWDDEDFINDDFTSRQFPAYDQYQKSYTLPIDIPSIDNEYSIASNYRKIIDLIGTFSPKILDEFEYMFLDFASENVTKESSKENDYFAPIKYRNFQELLKEICSVSKGDNDDTDYFTIDDLIDSLKLSQKINIQNISNVILSNNNLVKLTIGNPKEINPNLFHGFASIDESNRFTYNTYNISQATNENLNLIKLYLGEDVDGYYLEFFSTNDVELSEESILLFRPIILIYAGYRKDGNSANKLNFQNYLRNNVFISNTDTNNISGSSTRLSLYLFSLIRNFTTLKYETSEGSVRISQGYNNKPIKIELYNFFKSFNDKWIAGNSLGQRLLLEEFMFLDKANVDIGDKFYLNLDKLIDLGDPRNDKLDLYGALGLIIQNTGLDMRALPAYVNFFGVTKPNGRRKITPSTNVAKSLFGTFLEVDYQEASPKVIVQLVGPTSKHLADTNKNTYKFYDDSFNPENTSNNPLVITSSEAFDNVDLYKSNRVIAFEVNFGDQNQGIFKGIQLDQSSLKNTTESFVVLENLARSESGAATYNVDISLFNYYRQASYTCDITMMGDVMIQPTMFFYLKNIPMFRGTYWITEVNHTVRGNNIVTTFKGVRIPISSLPDPKDSFSSSYRILFDRVMQKAISKIDNQTRLNTPTTLSINVNGLNYQTDPGEKIEGEDVPNNIVQVVGINEFGVPFNGYNEERYIQKVKFEFDGKQEWLRSRVIQYDGENYPIDGDVYFKIVSEAENTTKVTWAEISGTTETKDFYSTKFLTNFNLLSQLKNPITPSTIRSSKTIFLNPKTKDKVNVESSISGTIGSRIITGPIGTGPYKNGYGLCMSLSLMKKLNVHDGDIVYFIME
jgi:hypothetical protein